MFVYLTCLLLFFLFVFAYDHRQQTRSLSTTRSILLRMHGVQSVAFIIGFIYDQSIFFKPCDCKSEDVVTANRLKRLVTLRERLRTHRVFTKDLCFTFIIISSP